MQLLSPLAKQRATAQSSKDKIMDMIGHGLKRARLSKGLTQSAVAERAGISERYLRMIEAGTVTPGDSVAIVLRIILTTDWLD